MTGSRQRLTSERRSPESETGNAGMRPPSVADLDALTGMHRAEVPRAVLTHHGASVDSQQQIAHGQTTLCGGPVRIDREDSWHIHRLPRERPIVPLHPSAVVAREG